MQNVSGGQMLQAPKPPEPAAIGGADEKGWTDFRVRIKLRFALYQGTAIDQDVAKYHRAPGSEPIPGETRTLEGSSRRRQR